MTSVNESGIIEVTDNAHDRLDIWGANATQEIITRNAVWAKDMLVSLVNALMKDGRPIFTEKIPESESLAALLAAPPQFWDAIQASDPESAAALVAQLLKAREKGKIPQIGPRADEVVPEDGPEVKDGTQPATPLPSFTQDISADAIV